MVSRDTTLVPSLGLRSGPACEAGLSAGKRRERVRPQRRKKKKIRSPLRKEVGPPRVRLWRCQHNGQRLWTTGSECRTWFTTVDNQKQHHYDEVYLFFITFFILLLLSNSDAASGGDEASSPDFYSLCHLHCNLWFVYRFIAGHALVLLLPLLLLLLALQLFKQNIDINVFAYVLFFLFYWAEPGGIGHWSGWLTIILQCCATVGWVIWPVKSSQKWPIMCRC